MANLDLAMPFALLVVMLITFFFNKRSEEKLKDALQGREFRTKDVIFLVAIITITISVIALISALNPGQIFQNIILVVFTLSYSMLLFIFSYLFSNLKKRSAQIFSLMFCSIGFFIGTISLLEPFLDSLTFFRALSFYLFGIFALSVILFEFKNEKFEERWFIAIQPTALYILFFVFFNLVYDGISIWSPILLNIYGLLLAVLIILYLSSLFTWKTAFIFAVLLTIVDVILVLGTGSMVVAAQQFTNLGLPMLVRLPNIPLRYVDGVLVSIGLGLGDFFFAGILSLQTYKKYGKKIGIIAALSMTISFGIFEAFLPEIIQLLEPILQREIGGFPGTLMIIIGWLPIVAWKIVSQNKIRDK
jgi:hypothetical protein